MAFKSSSSQNQDIRNGGTEPKKKLKKLISIKLSKLPSLKQSARRAKFRSDKPPKLSKLPSLKQSARRAKFRSDKPPTVLSSNALTPQKAYWIEMSESSPNYMKATSCFDARKASFQNQGGRNIGGTELKKKLKKSRSIKLAGFKGSRPSPRWEKSRFDRTYVNLSGDAASPQIPSPIKVSDASLKYMKASCFDARKVRFQASPRNSESSFDSNDKDRKNFKNLKPNSASSGQKSMRTLPRTSSLKPVRTLTKVSSLKPSMKKSSEVSRYPDLSIDRATCSSTLKDSKFHGHVKIHPGGSESEGISVMKVCPYTYCSLNGHHHAPLPPLTQFLSVRRHLLKTQKSMKLKSLSQPRAKHSGDEKIEIQTDQMIFNGDPSMATSLVIEEVGTDFFIEIHAKPRAKLIGGIHGGDGESINDFAGGDETRKKHDGELAEILLGETSYPERSIKENLDQIRNFLVAAGDIPVAFTEFKETSLECCCTKTEMDKSVSEATDEPSNMTKSPNPDDFVKSTAINSVVSSASVFDPLEEITAASDEKDGDSESDNEFLQGCTPVEDSEPSCTTHRARTTQLEKQKCIRMWHLIYQHMVSGIAAKVGSQQLLDGADKEEQVNDGNTLLGTKISGSRQACLKTDQDMGMENQDAGCQGVAPHQIDAIKLVQEAIDEILLPEIEDHSSDDQSVSSDINSDEELLEKNHGEGGELSISSSTNPAEDNFRVFDKIKVENGVMLDPEEKWLKADNSTTTEEEETVLKVGNKSDQQMPKSWSKLKKLILLKRFIKALERVRKFNPGPPRHLLFEPDPETEKVCLRNQMMDERKSAEEWMLDYALQQVVGKLAPSRKRRVALLVEAFEAISPVVEEVGMDFFIEIYAKPGAKLIGEGIHGGDNEAINDFVGGHETGKENDDNLAELQLGETLFPERSFNENLNQTSGFLTAERDFLMTFPEHKETSLECCCLKTQLDKFISEAPLVNLKEEKSVASTLDNGDGNYSLTDDQSDFIDFRLPVLKDSGLCNKLSLKPNDIVGSCCEEVPSLNSEFCKDDSESNGENLEIDALTSVTGEPSDITKNPTPDDFAESTAINSAVSSVSVCDPLKEPTAASEEKNGDSEPDNEFLQGLPPVRDSEHDCTAHEVYKTQLEKQKYIRMWQRIYQHVVSDSAAAVGTQLLSDGAEEEEQVDDANTLLGAKLSGSNQGCNETDHDMGMENQDSGCQNIELRHIDAIKLVQEAIDEILLPEILDHSLDDQSITSDINSDQELLRNNHGEGGELSISTSTDSAKDSFRECDKNKVGDGILLDPEETWLKAENITAPEEEKTVPKAENKSDQKMSKSWSKMKRLILLKRFIKELIKAREFNPREPRYLPLEPDPDAENVRLRHQMMDERKNAEEWMLDYALRQVANKLAPIQKRKVALLVEAFEAVIPLSEI